MMQCKRCVCVVCVRARTHGTDTQSVLETVFVVLKKNLLCILLGTSIEE